MSRAVIIGAAKIKNYKKVKSFLKNDDFFIFCDAGLNHQKKLKVKPDLIVGDFDSHRKVHSKVKVIELPVEKDDTDTFFAAKYAVKQGFTEVLLLGVIGERFDHSICNISVLIHLFKNNVKAFIVDDYSKMQIVSSKTVEVDKNCSFFSLMNVAGDVSGVYIENAKYPLQNAKINSDFMFGSGNSVLPNKKTTVRVENGILLLLEIF